LCLLDYDYDDDDGDYSDDEYRLIDEVTYLIEALKNGLKIDYYYLCLLLVFAAVVVADYYYYYYYYLIEIIDLAEAMLMVLHLCYYLLYCKWA
jgi:hypothetical protein